jgi:hypothetical protein
MLIFFILISVLIVWFLLALLLFHPLYFLLRNLLLNWSLLSRFQNNFTYLLTFLFLADDSFLSFFFAFLFYLFGLLHVLLIFLGQFFYLTFRDDFFNFLNLRCFFYIVITLICNLAKDLIILIENVSH